MWCCCFFLYPCAKGWVIVYNNNEKQNKTKLHRRGNLTIEDDVEDPMIYCDFATDVYSFGVLMWSLITRKLPYKGFKPLDMIKMIYNQDRLQVYNHEWQAWKDDANVDPKELSNLLNACWAQYPQDRPDIFQVSIMLQNLLTNAENDNRGVHIWPSTQNGATLVKQKSGQLSAASLMGLSNSFHSINGISYNND